MIENLEPSMKIIVIGNGKVGKSAARKRIQEIERVIGIITEVISEKICFYSRNRNLGRQADDHQHDEYVDQSPPDLLDSQCVA